MVNRAVKLLSSQKGARSSSMATAQCVLLLAVHILLISEFILANGDYYEILGVPKEATERQIKKAFHKLALMYHPDRNRGPNAEAKFREIAEGKPLCPCRTIGNYKTVKFNVNFERIIGMSSTFFIFQGFF